MTRSHPRNAGGCFPHASLLQVPVRGPRRCVQVKEVARLLRCPVLCPAGTDINGALQRGIRLLNDFVAHNDIEDRSVSLVIFLTDGKPTAGETHTPKILNNTREAARGRVCIFTVGIGADVDFKLLEMLSLENCGLTRHVHEDHDARAQLIGSVGLSVSSGWGAGSAGGSDVRTDPESDHHSFHGRHRHGS